MRQTIALNDGYRLCAITPSNSPLVELSGIEPLSMGYQKSISLVRQQHAVIGIYSPHCQPAKLVAFDLDGTLVEGEFMSHLAEVSLDRARGHQLRHLTQQALGGTDEWGRNYRQRVALLSGMEVVELQRRYRELPIIEGAKEMVVALRTQGCEVAIITGAWSRYAEDVAEQLSIAYCFATEWEESEGRLTGRVRTLPLDPYEKLSALRRLMESLQLTTDEVAVVGDGYNDIEMMKEAGCSISLHATPDNPLPLVVVIKRLLTKEI